MSNVKMRQEVERLIARAFIRDVLAAGYGLNVNNGGEEDELPEPSTDASAVEAAMFATDDERLIVYQREPKLHKPDEYAWRYIGWVLFIYGNGGWDVISDYTTNLQHLMVGADAESAKWQ